VYNNKEWIWPYREMDIIGSNPDPYSTSKACAELIIESYLTSSLDPKKFLKEHNTLIAAVRAGNVIGGGDWAKDRLMTDIIRNIFEKNEKIILRSPNAIRPWQHVLEPLYGYILLSKQLFEEKNEFAGAWNFGPNEENFICVEDLVKNGISYIGKGEYKIQADTKKHEANLLKLDSSKAKLKLGWKTLLNIDSTLKWTFDWYEKYYKEEDMIELTKKQINLFFKNT
jgi:CDP-glucose 4,6-dehydratase